MPTVTYTFSASVLTTASEAISARYGYEPLIDGLPNPETKQQFFRRWWLDKLKDEVRAHRLGTARAAVPIPVDIEVT